MIETVIAQASCEYAPKCSVYLCPVISSSNQLLLFSLPFHLDLRRKSSLFIFNTESAIKKMPFTPPNDF